MISRVFVRIAPLAACLAVGAARPAAGQGTPPMDPQRMGGAAMRALAILQSFQIANTPELSAAVAEVLSDSNAHMKMGPRRPATRADSARAVDIVKTARAALSKYKDVKVAEQDGYIEFMPWLTDQPIYHYNNLPNVLATLQGFDATKPVSLLYKKNPKGELQLVGVMYSAAPVATNEDLDMRLPISIAHWHEHVNFCGPDPRAVSNGAVKVDAASTVKWVKITTKEACDAAGGRFVPRLFGWMAHVYLFAGSDDPKVIWGGDDHGSMDVHMHHPPE